MRKQLRKKRHLGEFRQFGFSVKCKLRDGISSDDFDHFIDAFVAEAIERQGLVFGGGGSPTTGWDGIACRHHRHESTTEAHREAVASWLKQRAEVASFIVSPAWDVWHGTDPFDAPVTTSSR